MSNSKKGICCFGEILWDLLPTGKMPGGAPMNVAIHLKNLGMEVACITRVGDDLAGDELKEFLRSKNCPTTWVQSDKQQPTGTVNVNVSDRTNVQYEIVHPVAWDFIATTREALEVSRNAYAFVFGTLACRDITSRETLFTLLDYTTALKIYDVNLRAPHYSQELVRSLLPRADMVKMNEDELVTIHGWLGLPSSSFDLMVKEVRSKFGLKTVIVTRGGDGAVLLDANGMHTSRVYKVQVKDTIGSGDSFLAGMIKNFYLDTAPAEALNYACALGALVAQHHGANPGVSEEEIFELMKRGA